MCTNSRIMLLKKQGYDNSAYFRSVDEYWYNKRYVSCGKCAECLRVKQNDLAARCVRQAQLSGCMQFLTLTYSDDYLPYSMVLERIDKDTGEVFKESLKLITRQSGDVVENGLNDLVTSSLKALDKNKVRYYFRTIYESECELYRVVVTPSLNPRDVRLWLKRARVLYEREYHVKLDFKYVACGEMGSHTNRPHYHLALFGISYQVCAWLASLWKYGFTYLRQVNAVNKDGTSGFELAGRYIGKYISKGCFECESVTSGYAYKPRLMASKNLGGSLPEHVVNYFRCYDLVGDYDINKPLSQDVLSRLVPETKKRFRFNLGGKDFRLPNKFIKQIWYVKNSEGRLVASAVRRQITSALLSDLFGNSLEKLRLRYPSKSLREIFALYQQEKLLEKACQQVKNERGMRSLYTFYLNSNF